MDASTSLSEKETVFNLVFAAGGVRYYLPQFFNECLAVTIMFGG